MLFDQFFQLSTDCPGTNRISKCSCHHQIVIYIFLTGNYRDRTYTGKCGPASLNTHTKKRPAYGYNAISALVFSNVGLFLTKRHLNNFQDVKILYLSKQNDK